MALDKTTRDYIAGLKASNIDWRQDERGRYRIRILGRGENGFYEESPGRALLFELVAGESAIFSKSIRRWDDGRKVSDADKDVVLKRLVAYLGHDGAPVIVR